MLVLTERTEHLEAIKAALGNKVAALTVLHGRLSKKLRAPSIASQSSGQMFMLFRFRL